MRRSARLSVLLGALSMACDGGAGDSNCTVATGSYQLLLTPVAGDCPADLVDEVASAGAQPPYALSVAEPTSCDRFATDLVMTHRTSRDCTLTMELRATHADTAGIVGSAAVHATCQDGTVCDHAFDFRFDTL